MAKNNSLWGNKYLLDMDSDSGEVVLARLLRFKLRTDCELNLKRGGGNNIIGKDASSFAGKTLVRANCSSTLWPQISSVDIIGGERKRF
ncbi:MAG: hypothetical protein Ct9H90mP11_08350 [Acidimicrobiales bacterium]|nr:MAG: hypothetical protein Ct9H90mP11_08350 [Acidimicrobiales bacterium]